jgi:AraC-like DNA-binding protein
LVLEACQKLRLRVPDDAAVVGVDNDPMVCDFCDPPLTSISRNDYQVGYEAAALLDQLMDGNAPPGKPVRIPPAGIVQRRSSDTVAVEDPYVAEAIQYMRQHVGEHFGVEELLEQIPLSRRSLEYRFRACLGRSPYDFLNQIRVDQAKRLLSDPHRSSLTKIAMDCGFGDLRRFRIVFQRLVDANPAEYRQAAFRIARGEPGRATTIAKPRLRNETTFEFRLQNYRRRTLNHWCVLLQLRVGNAWSQGGFPIDAFGAGPELFQGVIVAGLVVEQMDDHVAIILQNPRAGGVAFHAIQLLVELFGQRVLYFIGNGVELTSTGAGDQQEVIELGRQLPQIEKHNLLPAIFVRHLRGRYCHPQTALLTMFSR